jgi:hypothetical protein
VLELIQGGPALTQARYRVVWEPLDEQMFAVYSGLSGETHLLNDTAVWLLELLSEPGWHLKDDIVHRAATESQVTDNEAGAAFGDFWTSFIDGGLLQLQRRPTGAA